MTDGQRDSFHNLIYLCGDHHTQIDRQESDFPATLLRSFKAEHEGKVREALHAAFGDVAFPELQVATAWIKRASAHVRLTDYHVLDPDAKIRRNDLTEASRITITMGLSIVSLVHAFVEHEATLAPDYPQRLKSGFLAEYHALRRDGSRGDVLFEAMCEVAQRGIREQAGRSAAIAVLVYLFERCEVFEK